MRGGYGSGDHGTLADRIARQNATAAPTAQLQPEPQSRPQPQPQSRPQPGPAPATTVPAGPARHCRVDGEPSLLVEWCRTERGWEGRVVSVVWIDAVGWATVARWLPAADIEPVG